VAGPKVHHLSYFRRAESARPMLDALAGNNEEFERLNAPSREHIGRGGDKVLAKDNAPIALMLPGVMGSQLAADGDRIWFNPLRMLGGGMERLKLGAAATTAGWIDRSYDDFAKQLALSHEVRPFVYDWRLSITQAAQKFGDALDRALKDAAQRGKPLRIVAHSMGGLVARLALKERWEKLRALPGSRLVQFGTPNGGSHSIACVLMGRDEFVRAIAFWADWKHDMNEFLQIVRDFPGVLELLPWAPADGKDYFDPDLWKQWASADVWNKGRLPRGATEYDTAKGAPDGWPAPQKGPLQAAKKAVDEIVGAPLDKQLTLYVAGRARTPVDVRVRDGQVEIGWTEEGDGRVPWATGIPPELPCWYVDAAHGSLLSHKKAFGQYLKLIETGQCSLPTQRPLARGERETVYAPAPVLAPALYPT
ncbi:MAG: hypothetical protein JNJ60_09185, partial [Rhodocyclaceae bacterium]|nr:hypothetical protein [Rhodocyclaceae bacterium]